MVREQGLANFLVWWLFSFFWGMVSAINTLVAQKVGADDQRGVGVTFWQGHRWKAGLYSPGKLGV